VLFDFRKSKEAKIRGVLRQLSRQRVALVLQPGDVWVIEKAVKANEDTDTALKTCYLRGWIELIENAIPKGDVPEDGRLPNGSPFTRAGPLYRITDSGWSVINRANFWVLTTALVSVLGVLVGIIAILVARH
jgi:hypothetical protein